MTALAWVGLTIETEKEFQVSDLCEGTDTLSKDALFLSLIR